MSGGIRLNGGKSYIVMLSSNGLFAIQVDLVVRKAVHSFYTHRKSPRHLAEIEECIG